MDKSGAEVTESVSEVVEDVDEDEVVDEVVAFKDVAEVEVETDEVVEVLELTDGTPILMRGSEDAVVGVAGRAVVPLDVADDAGVVEAPSAVDEL